jgi:hypothetical protein
LLRAQTKAKEMKTLFRRLRMLAAAALMLCIMTGGPACSDGGDSGGGCSDGSGGCDGGSGGCGAGDVLGCDDSSDNNWYDAYMADTSAAASSDTAAAAGAGCAGGPNPQDVRTGLTDDIYEDNDSRETAATLAADLHAGEKLTAMGLALLDPDWYRVVTTETTDAVIRVIADADADVMLAVIKPDGTTTTVPGRGPGGGPVINLQSVPAGELLICVTGSITTYSLDIEAHPPAAVQAEPELSPE